MLTAFVLSAAILTPDVTCRVRNSKGQLVRSMTRRGQFLKALGYADGKPPAGYCVDHISPLICGGCDVGSNMALMRCDEMREKDDAMRVRAKAPLCNVPMGPILDPPVVLHATPAPAPSPKGK